MTKTKTQNGRDARVKKLVTNALIDSSVESLRLVSQKMEYFQGSKRYFLTNKQLGLAIEAFIKVGGGSARTFINNLKGHGYLDKRKPLIPLFSSRSFHAIEFISETLEQNKIQFKIEDLLAMLKVEDDNLHDKHVNYALGVLVDNIADNLTVDDIERICYVNNEYSYGVIEKIFEKYGEKFVMKRVDVPNVAPNVNSTIYSIPLGLDSEEDDRGNTYMVGYLDATDSVTLVAVYSGNFALTGMNEETFLRIQAAGNPLLRDGVLETLKTGFEQSISTGVGTLTLT